MGGDWAAGPSPRNGEHWRINVNCKRNELDNALNGICSDRALSRCQTRASESEPSEERAYLLADLKRQIREGIYKPDIKDIARMLAGAVAR